MDHLAFHVHRFIVCWCRIALQVAWQSVVSHHAKFCDLFNHVLYCRASRCFWNEARMGSWTHISEERCTKAFVGDQKWESCSVFIGIEEEEQEASTNSPQHGRHAVRFGLAFSVRFLPIWTCPHHTHQRFAGRAVATWLGGEGGPWFCADPPKFKDGSFFF